MWLKDDDCEAANMPWRSPPLDSFGKAALHARLGLTSPGESNFKLKKKQQQKIDSY